MYTSVNHKANKYTKDLIFLNYGERYEEMIDRHRSYTHNLSSCEIKA